MKKILILCTIVSFYSCKKEEPNITAPVPVVIIATEIGSNSFRANWQTFSNVIGYELDVATNEDFANIIFCVSRFSGSSFLITDLDGNTDYFYQVRSMLDTINISENSNTVSVTTLLEPPVALGQSNTTQTEFTANWTSVTDVSEYILYVSLGNFPANPPNNLPNYDGISVADTTQVISGLMSATTYYYVIKSKLGELISEESNTIIANTR